MCVGSSLALGGVEAMVYIFPKQYLHYTIYLAVVVMVHSLSPTWFHTNKIGAQPREVGLLHRRCSIRWSGILDG
jgi:hypothetical protein